MPTFDITFMRVDREEAPTVVEHFFQTVEWSVLPRDGDGITLTGEIGAITVESVGYTPEGYPTCSRVASCSMTCRRPICASTGWQVSRLPFGRR